jgi:hypothetical protein
MNFEIVHAVTLENYVPWFKEGDALSDGDVLQLDLLIL